MSYLAQMLNFERHEPVKPQKQPPKYTHEEVREKYRQALLSPKTVLELSKCLGYTLEGTGATMRRYRKKGIVRACGSVGTRTAGRNAVLYVWSDK